MAAVARLVSARAILLLAIIGGFVLGLMAIQNPDWIRLAVLVSYGVLIVIPLVWLERDVRHGGGQ